MSVRLGQVATVAAIAALASNKKAAGVVALLTSTGLVKITQGESIQIPKSDTNGIPKFEPKTPNINKALRKRDKCIDLQLKLGLEQLNFKLPSISLSFSLPQIPTWNLAFLADLLNFEIQCVAEALALIAAIKALQQSLQGFDSPSAAFAASATGLGGGIGVEQPTANGVSSPVSERFILEFRNPNL